MPAMPTHTMTTAPGPPPCPRHHTHRASRDIDIHTPLDNAPHAAKHDTTSTRAQTPPTYDSPPRFRRSSFPSFKPVSRALQKRAAHNAALRLFQTTLCALQSRPTNLRAERSSCSHNCKNQVCLRHLQSARTLTCLHTPPKTAQAITTRARHMLKRQPLLLSPHTPPAIAT